jgi:putative restriction endonuclease
VKYWVGVTDNNWFEFLSQKKPDEVNFWRPKSTNQFRAIEEGALFLFKLHSPQNYIVGGAFLFRHTILPLSLAWNAFQENNGVPDLVSFKTAINRVRRDNAVNPLIGCTLLTNPFFFTREDWVLIPKDWKGNLVQGKTYESQDGSYGEALWQDVQKKMIKTNQSISDNVVKEDSEAYGNPISINPRIGQGTFRVTVADAYNRRCAITGESTLFVLEAAHIKPYAQSHSHKISNGMFLRSDFHTLFDQGYISITPDYKIMVSDSIKEQFNNGKLYYAHQGKKLLSLPSRGDWLPNKEYLEWHNAEVFAA